MINYNACVYLSYIAYHTYYSRMINTREDVVRSYRTSKSLKQVIINNYRKPDRNIARQGMFKCYY